MRLWIVFVSTIVMTVAIDLEFHDLFGGLRKVSIPECTDEPCVIVQGVPLVTYVTFAPESPQYPQNKTFEIFTAGYIDILTYNYADKFGEGLINDTDLTKYDTSFPLTPGQLSTAKIPMVIPWVDPSIGPFETTGVKYVYFSMRVGNDTDSITIVSASISLNFTRPNDG